MTTAIVQARGNKYGKKVSIISGEIKFILNKGTMQPQINYFSFSMRRLKKQLFKFEIHLADLNVNFSFKFSVLYILYIFICAQTSKSPMDLSQIALNQFAQVNRNFELKKAFCLKSHHGQLTRNGVWHAKYLWITAQSVRQFEAFYQQGRTGQKVKQKDRMQRAEREFKISLIIIYWPKWKAEKTKQRQKG